MGWIGVLGKLIGWLPGAVSAVRDMREAISPSTPPKPVPFNEKHQWEYLDPGPPPVVLSKPYCVFCGETQTSQSKDAKCLGPRPKIPS